MNPDILFSLLRHALTTAGGVLIARGYATNDDITNAAGAILTLIGVAWSIYTKAKAPTSSPPAPPKNGDKLFRLNSLPLLLSALSYLLATGCSSAPSGQISLSGSNTGDLIGTVALDVTTNTSVGLTVTGNPLTGAVSGGITITFNREPDTALQTLLTQAGAIPIATGKTPSLTWRLPNWDYRNPDQSAALSAALQSGARLTR